MNNFVSMTVFVLSYDETTLLCETIHQIRKHCLDKDLYKIIVIVPSAQCPSYEQAQKIMQTDSKVALHIQTNPGICNAFADMEALMNSSHFVIMGSDMEMDPRTLSQLIERAKIDPDRIISASKWLPESTVTGYGKLHALCSRTLNLLLRALIGRQATDLISIFEVYPTDLYREMHFESPEECLYAMTVKPLSRGTPYEEVPTNYQKRSTGKTHFKLPSLIHHALCFLKAAWHYRNNK